MQRTLYVALVNVGQAASLVIRSGSETEEKISSQLRHAKYQIEQYCRKNPLKTVMVTNKFRSL